MPSMSEFTARKAKLCIISHVVALVILAASVESINGKGCENNDKNCESILKAFFDVPNLTYDYGLERMTHIGGRGQDKYGYVTLSFDKLKDFKKRFSAIRVRNQLVENLYEYGVRMPMQTLRERLQKIGCSSKILNNEGRVGLVCIYEPTLSGSPGI